MAGGRLFQTRGPATANALSPSDVVVVRGMSSIILAADIRCDILAVYHNVKGYKCYSS